MSNDDTTGRVLLSLASRQIWPQVLSVLSERPGRLFLFHSQNEAESKRPAQRLRDFFASRGILERACIELVQVPSDSFSAIVDAFADLAEKEELDDTNCRVNLTGGNKLMAMAAAEWCRLAEAPCFYLDRGSKVFPFRPGGGDLLPEPPFVLDVHLAREVDPLGLLGCQMDGAEIVDNGQRLTLNERGRKLPEREIGVLLRRSHDFRGFLDADRADTETKQGDGLEYVAALALLRLGVPVVQRSVRLSPRVLRGSGKEEGELDLVFNWAGKLWVVDCKDRLGAEARVDRLRQEILKQATITLALHEQLDRVAAELRNRALQPLKEDLLTISEVGGLLGRAICVRREPLPAQAHDFARSRGIHVVLRDRLVSDLKPVLYPDQPASLEQLRELSRVKTGARP